ncbi:MAG: phage tail tape measure protein, partial [Blastocatellia bacterium]
MAFQALEFLIKGNASGAVEAFKQVVGQAQTMKSSMGSVSQSINSFSSDLTKYVTLPLLGVGAALLKVGSDFDDAFDRIRVGTGQIGPELENLQQSFRNVVSDVPASFENASIAVTELAKRTSATGEAFDTLAKQELELARITGADLKGQIEATTSAFNNWGISAAQQGEKLDFLFKVSQQTGIGVTELSKQLAQSGGIAKAAGLSFETSAGLIAQLSKNGIDASGVIQGFSKALSLIARKGGDADPTAVLTAMVEKIKQAGSESKANALSVEFFGKSGIKMGEAIRSGKLDVDGLLKTIQGSGETILKAGQDTADYAESFTLLKNKVMLAVEPLAVELFQALNSLTPAFEKIVGWLTSAVKWFTELDGSTKKIIGGFAFLVAAIGPSLFAFSKLISVVTGTYNAFTSVVAYVPQVVAGLRSINLATAAATAGWIGLAGAAIYAMAKIAEGQPDAKLASKTPMAGGIAVQVGGLGQNRVQQGLVNWMLGEKSPFKQPLAIPVEFDVVGPQLSKTGQDEIAFENKLKNDTARIMGNVKDFGAGHAKSAGAGMSKALVNGFADGLTGFQAAVAKIDSSDLSVLFDRLGKNARAGAEETSAALKVVTAGINEFVSSQGVAAKINEAQLATMDVGTRKSLESQTLAYKIAHEEIDRILVEGVASKRIAIGVTQDMLNKMSGDAKKAFTDLGGSFQILPPTLKAVAVSAAEEGKATSSAMQDMAKQSQASFDAFQERANRLAVELPKPFKDASIAIIDAAAQMKKALGEDESLLVIKAQLDIRNSIESTISTVEEFGRAAGYSGDALSKFVADTVRQMPAFAGAHEAGVNKALAAHEKAAIQLPGIWGPIFDKLGLNAKKWASDIIGIINVLPGKFGDAARGIFSTISTWVDFGDRVLGVLNRLGVKAPQSMAELIAKIGTVFKSGFGQMLSGLAVGAGGLIASITGGGGALGSG